MVCLRSLIERLRKEGEIADVHHPVDPTLEIPEIHRRVASEQGPALFFHNVKGSTFPVVTNLFGSPKRVELAFGHRPEKLIEELAGLAMRPSLRGVLGQAKHLMGIGKRRVRRPAVGQKRLDSLEKIPFLKCWPDDGGHFLTLPLVYTESPEGGPSNLGMYRIQRYDANTTGLHFQIAKGGGFHYHQAEQMGQNLPVSIFLGGPAALILSAITPLPENVPELLFASMVLGKKLRMGEINGRPVVADAEFALIGEARPHERRIEGPFGDHYGYYSLDHEFPVFHCKAIYHRKDAIYPATVVGKPKQEDFYLGDYLQKLLAPLIKLAIPGAKAIWSYGETGFHSLAAAIVNERYHRECMATAFRILGEGQLALTKFLLVTDQNIDVSDIKQVLPTILERFRPETDLYIFANLSMDTLDYTGPKLNQGSRGVMLGIGEKIRDLPTEYRGPHKTRIFCPGVLLVEEKSDDFKSWPLVILVDDVEKANEHFLWTVFTRFEPAADIYAEDVKVHRHHLCYQGSILIDARMKASYPPVVECDETTYRLVDRKWKDYFA